MKKTRVFRAIGLLVGIVYVGGCSTDSASQGHRDNSGFGGLVIVASELVAMPIIPFTAPYGMIADAKERKQDAILYERLDPVYQKRIEMIKARSPKADAEAAWNQGARVFLPFQPNGAYYLGVETTEYNLKNGVENQRQIDNNKLLTYIQTLLSNDPLQEQAKAFSKTFGEFTNVRAEYRKSFNREMYQLIQNASPQQNN